MQYDNTSLNKLSNNREIDIEVLETNLTLNVIYKKKKTAVDLVVQFSIH